MPSQSRAYRSVPSCFFFVILTNVPSYRTMSIHVETLQEKKSVPKRSADTANAVRQIDVHLLSPDQIFTRFSSSPTLGLEDIAVQRRSKSGKNVISPPRTQYWKKALNYVFGGFNFLMWIAFIVTIVCSQYSVGDSRAASVCHLDFLPTAWKY